MMETVKPAVRWFQDIGAADTNPADDRWASMLEEAGGKGANLAEMTQSGIPVPPGFVVLAGSYFEFLEASRLRPLIERELSHLDVGDNAALNRAADNVKRAIMGAELPQHIASEITSAYNALGGGYVAVRSSATAEDLPDASFAGQQSTFLNVRGTAHVLDAVKGCWASLFEARAIFYRAEQGFDHFAVGIAVPVQRMVEAEVSGVMFTVEPVFSDDSKIFIEAIFGLGEGIVSGQINPDTYVIDKSSMKLLRGKTNYASQEWELVRDRHAGPSAEGANRKATIEPSRRDKPKLTDAEILELAEIGQGLEEHYGHPQDIEWALEGGTFYILQTRPVTTLDLEADETDVVVDAPLILSGSAASPGVASGQVVIILNPAEIDRVQEGDVLVAEMTTPDFVPAMKRAAAIVTDKGGRTCHAAIVSRELGVPCIVGTDVATAMLKQGQLITVDATAGNVYEGAVEIKRRTMAEVSKYEATKTLVYVNLADPDLAERVAALPVDGVGLLRAEFIAAHIGEHPRYMLERGRGREFTEKLAKGIRSFAQAFYPRPVTYRCTDFKTNEYRGLVGGEKFEAEEENPMIGYRGCARYLAEPDVFRLETDAIKRVLDEFDNLNVMIPFVRTPEELAAVKTMLRANGILDPKIWIMVEVPSTVLLLEKFIDVGIDGISIGSNDLTQLILGVDRDNSKHASVFDERNEAVMVAIEKVVKTGRDRGVTVSICGQAPSVYPEITAKLVDWGITSVSVSPDMIVRTRDIVGDVERKLGVLPPQP